LKKLGVVSIGIFGSIVHNKDTKESDYDILVELEKDKKSFKIFTSLCDLFEEHLGTNFELITKESLSPYIGPRILEEVEYVKITS
ncbi:MAG: nucleotidyltransferase domain-containing protein, partial [Planctomycetota bacterium]